MHRPHDDAGVSAPGRYDRDLWPQAGAKGWVERLYHRVRLRRTILWGGDWRGLEVLDVGCNTGLFSAALAAEGAHVTALDINREHLRKAAHYLGALEGIRLVHGDIRSLPHSEGAFDVVLMVNVLEYLPKAGLPFVGQEVARVLRPNGRAIVAAAWAGGLLCRSVRLWCWLTRRPFDEVARLKPNLLRLSHLCQALKPLRLSACGVRIWLTTLFATFVHAGGTGDEVTTRAQSSMVNAIAFGGRCGQTGE